jgi:hypothetical protein
MEREAIPWAKIASQRMLLVHRTSREAAKISVRPRRQSKSLRLDFLNLPQFISFTLVRQSSEQDMHRSRRTLV